MSLLGAIVVLAAAATTTAVPSLRALVTAHGGGAGAGALFVAAHVVGQVAGAALIGRRLRAMDVIAARRLVVTALVASAAITGAMAALAAVPGTLASLVGLRFADGVAHVAAIMGLLGAVTGDEEDRERRLRLLGGLLVIGIAAGLGTGTLLVGASIEAPIAAGAGLAAIAALLASAAVPRRVARTPRATGPVIAPRATVLAVAAERFAFGVITVGLPFLAASPSEARVIGATLGTMMLASVATLPLVAAAARRAGWARVGQVSAAVLAAALALVAAPGLVGSPTGFPWAVVGGVAAAGIYASALAAVAAIADAGARARAVGVVHAAGSAGHAVGALLAGAAMSQHGLGLAASHATALLGALAVSLAGVILVLRGR